MILVCASLSGCVYQELTATHVEPGGTVTASLSGGMARTSTGLADATSDPFQLSGFSPFLTFGIIAGDAQAGQISAALKTAGAAVDLPLSSGGKNMLEIHTDGTGCSATTGIIHLRAVDDGHVAGDFSAMGTRTNSQDACTIDGMLDAIPVDR